ncbi:hypothetical protein IW261DRAFT_354820 [Armillaria novae-zelandiae]|uniref:Uncharacterized protein n=1 Tax=Armillaria novae-zelandiae TaxID=153914 RepID=A0AA39ULZ3_9AGAR|nr:hypothetical protein IW261DRAFT_354820 [Armillaria novae-zelandiae]
MQRDIIDISCLRKFSMKPREKIQMLLRIAYGNYQLCHQNRDVYASLGLVGLGCAYLDRIASPNKNFLQKKTGGFYRFIKRGKCNAFRAALQQTHLAVGASSPPDRANGMGLVHKVQCENAQTILECRIMSLDREVTHKYQVQAIPNTTIVTFGIYFITHPITPPFCGSKNATRVVSKSYTILEPGGNGPFSTTRTFLGELICHIRDVVGKQSTRSASFSPADIPGRLVWA